MPIRASLKPSFVMSLVIITAIAGKSMRLLPASALVRPPSLSEKANPSTYTGRYASTMYRAILSRVFFLLCIVVNSFQIPFNRKSV